MDGANKLAIDASGKPKYPPIYFAILSSNIEGAEKLIEDTDEVGLRLACSLASGMGHKEIAKALRKELKVKDGEIASINELPSYFDEIIKPIASSNKKKYLKVEERGEVGSMESKHSDDDGNESVKTNATGAGYTPQKEKIEAEISELKKMIEALTGIVQEGQSRTEEGLKNIEGKVDQVIEGVGELSKELKQAHGMLESLYKWKEEELQSNDLEGKGWIDCTGQEILSISIKRHLMRMYEGHVEAVYGRGICRYRCEHIARNSTECHRRD